MADKLSPPDSLQEWYERQLYNGVPGGPTWIDNTYIHQRTAAEMARIKALSDQYMSQQKTPPAPKTFGLPDYSDEALVMEMLARGFVVQKLPQE